MAIEYSFLTLKIIDYLIKPTNKGLEVNCPDIICLLVLLKNNCSIISLIELHRSNQIHNINSQSVL